MDTIKKNEEIQVTGLFHISNNSTYIVCQIDSKCKLSFPSEWQLFEDEKYITNVKLQGMVMDGHKISDEGYQIMTFWVIGHIEKKMFNFEKRMLLKSSY